MVSNNGPPLPMPMQVPPGHMVQQIVDEHGILTHVILSPQPPGMPNQPMTVGYYVCISCFFPSLLCQQTVYGMLGYAKLLYAWAWFGHHVGCWHTCFAETGISIVWKKVILFMFVIYIYIYLYMWLNGLSCQYLSFKRKYYPDNLMKMFFYTKEWLAKKLSICI